jgi:hypothetical protein
LKGFFGAFLMLVAILLWRKTTQDGRTASPLDGNKSHV